MSNLIPFNFESNSIRAVIIDNEPWFVLSDICAVLEIGNTSDAAKRLDKDEVTLDTIEGSHRPTNLVNESGLYSLILTSRKAEAKKFKKWVTSEVLPSVRKTGGYSIANLSKLEILQLALESEQKRVELEQKLIEQKPAVEFVEKYANASSGNLGFRQVCKLFDINERWMRNFFKKKGIMYKLGGEWAAYRQHIDAGRFVVSTGLAEHDSGESHAFTTAKFTPKGVSWLAGLIYEERMKQGGN